MLTKYDYEKIADDISSEYMDSDTPLNDSISVTAIKMKLNPEQIKRLSELTNIKTYNKMYDSSEDKTFEFDLADNKKIINEVYSDDEENKKDTEIKDMPDVQYSIDKNPKRPEHNYELLGDDNELEISKNTSNSEDSASDTFEDALKIPKKDYSYTDVDARDIAESESTSLEDDGDLDGSMEDEDEKRKNKMASIETRNDVLKELNTREMLISDKLIANIHKSASCFRGIVGRAAYSQFEKNARILHVNNGNLEGALSLIKNELKIEENFISTNKIASEVTGLSQFKELLNTYDEYVRIKKAQDLVSE